MPASRFASIFFRSLSIQTPFVPLFKRLAIRFNPNHAALACSVWLIVSPARAASAQTLSPASVPGSAVAVGSRPMIQPVRVQQPPTIDGRLDDPAWKNAARITEFVQRRPLDGAPASEPTDVFVAYDSERIYFGIHAHYSEASLMRANRVDRDQIWEDDRVSVIFDPFRDQQRGYRLAVNGYGVQGDALIGNTVGQTTAAAIGDTSWNVLFASAGVISEDGWTAELAVPFKSLR